jgi:hypothetical protein
MNKNQLQQGDVWIEKVENIPDGAKVIDRHGILAYGEATGHKHQLEDTNIKIHEIRGRFFVKVDKAVSLVHEEHKPITIDPGIWEFGQVREKDWLSGMVAPVVD